MKIFISGSKSINKAGKEWMLPDSVRGCLDEIMADGSEIVIGDCWGIDTMVQEYLSASKYKFVTVYASGSHKTMRSNLGHWEEKWFSPNGRTPYVYRIEKDFHMAEDCDSGVTIWDGKSKGTFINMLCLCALKKSCRLYLLKEERWINVDSLEDLRGLSGDEGIISEDDVCRVLTACGFSDELTDYLVKEQTLSPFELIDIISRAPITLDEKSALFSSLGNKQNLKFEAFASVEENIKQGKSFKAIKHDIRALADFREEKSVWTVLYDRSQDIQAAREGLYSTAGDMYDNKPLVLFAEWYDVDEIQLKSSSCGVFVSPDAIERYIENEEYDNDSDEGYYRMEAWDADDTKWENPRYDYYYYRGKICWFEKLIPEEQEHGNTYFMSGDREFADGSLDLSFKTPYKSGDIVIIDCRPFGPPFHAMILEARDQWDCCFPNIVFRYPGTNEWSLTPLKHRRLYKDIGLHTYEPMLSPLYRLRRLREEELTEEDDCLLELSKLLSGSEEKAAEVWNNWHSASGDGLNWTQVLDIFQKLR